MGLGCPSGVNLVADVAGTGSSRVFRVVFDWIGFDPAQRPRRVHRVLLVDAEAPVEVNRIPMDWRFCALAVIMTCWERRSETRPVRRSESEPPAGRLFYAD